MKNLILLSIWIVALLFCEYMLYPQPGKMCGVLFAFLAVLVIAIEVIDASDQNDDKMIM